MEENILRPDRDEIKAKGKMYYHPEDHAWNILRIKKEILNEFKPLKEKMSKFSYNMFFHSEWNNFELAIRRHRRKGLPPPIMMWFVKENL